MGLQCYIKLPRKDDELYEQKRSFFIEIKLGTNTIHDLKSQLSDEYDPLIDQDFLSQM